MKSFRFCQNLYQRGENAETCHLIGRKALKTQCHTDPLSYGKISLIFCLWKCSSWWPEKDRAVPKQENLPGYWKLLAVRWETRRVLVKTVCCMQLDLLQEIDMHACSSPGASKKNKEGGEWGEQCDRIAFTQWYIQLEFSLLNFHRPRKKGTKPFPFLPYFSRQSATNSVSDDSFLSPYCNKINW